MNPIAPAGPGANHMVHQVCLKGNGVGWPCAYQAGPGSPDWFLNVSGCGIEITL
jgi:hypothetical protein